MDALKLSIQRRKKLCIRGRDDKVTAILVGASKSAGQQARQKMGELWLQIPSSRKLGIGIFLRLKWMPRHQISTGVNETEF
jgi:hypothetical protein